MGDVAGGACGSTIGKAWTVVSAGTKWDGVGTSGMGLNTDWLEAGRAFPKRLLGRGGVEVAPWVLKVARLKVDFGRDGFDPGATGELLKGPLPNIEGIDARLISDFVGVGDAKKGSLPNGCTGTLEDDDSPLEGMLDVWLVKYEIDGGAGIFLGIPRGPDPKGVVISIGIGVSEASGTTMLGAPNEDKSGGVLGLGDFLMEDPLFSSRDSVLRVGNAPDRGFGDTRIFGDCSTLSSTLSCLSFSFSSSSSPDTGVLANGELRAGRVLGLPKPSPNGRGAAEEPGGFLDSFVGVPGGVELSSVIVDKPEASEDSDSSDAGGDGVT